MDRVLDLLHTIKWEQDGTLDLPALLRPRRVRLGRDADQRPQPAGLQDPGRAARRRQISVAPLPGLPVIKDLVVDMDGFFAKYRSVEPFLINDEPAARPASGSSRPRSGPATTTRPSASCAPPAPRSCPSFWAQPDYVGPAAIVKAHRFIFDSRDEAAEERLEILADEDGVWRCRTIFNCTDACPRGIKVTRAILEVSAAIVERQV